MTTTDHAAPEPAPATDTPGFEEAATRAIRKLQAGFYLPGNPLGVRITVGPRGCELDYRTGKVHLDPRGAGPGGMPAGSAVTTSLAIAEVLQGLGWKVAPVHPAVSAIQSALDRFPHPEHGGELLTEADAKLIAQGISLLTAMSVKIAGP